MFLRSPYLLPFLTFVAMSFSQSPKDAIPPNVVQFGAEVCARPASVTVGELHLVNVVHATVDEQHQIATSVVGFCFPQGNTDELSERVRYGFQRLGFFKAGVTAVTIEPLNAKVKPPSVSVIARVEEGNRYGLKEITFFGDNAPLHYDRLRSFFRIKDGDEFDPEKVREGLQKLRSAYTDLGYINFTAVPETEIDEESNMLALTIRVEEGGQFYVKSFTVKADPERQAELRAVWPLPPGKIYNARLVELFFAQEKQLLPPGASVTNNLVLRQNPTKHTLDIILNAEQ